jgi:hypothetical protein
MKKIISLLLLALALFMIIGFIPGCKGNGAALQEKVQEALNKEPSAIEEVVICKSVDSNYAPVDPTTDFPPGTSSIYLTVKFKNFSKNDTVIAVWSYLGTGKEISTQQFTPEKFGSGYYSFNIKFTDGFPSGKYNVLVYFNKNLFKTIEFTVKEKV